MANIKNIIFDFGGVLIGWDPAELYRSIFHTEEEVSWFLENICTAEWNEQQDAGRTIADANKILLDKFPDHKNNIIAYYGRWSEMLTGSIDGTVDILKNQVEANKYRMYGLTNWSAETFPIALEKYQFLQWFDGIVVSGAEKCKKPEDEIYKILLERYQLIPDECVFIDDNKNNIQTAERLGIHGIHFQSPEQLHLDLESILTKA